MKNLGLVTMCVLAALGGAAQAEDPSPDKFKLQIGAFNTSRSEAVLSVTDPDAGIGASINPRDAFDLDSTTTVLRIEGYYRFNDRHSLTYSWYNIQTDGNKEVESEIDWVDQDGNDITIPIGARLDSSLDTEIYKVGYLYSFYRSDKLEVGIGGGFHITRVEINLDTNLTNPPNSSVNRVDSTLPLPVISLAMRYNVTDKFGWYVKSEAFALSYDDWVGSYRDTIFGVEYRMWRHVGLGLALTTNALKIEEDASDYSLKYDNSTTGGLFYVSTYF